MATQPGIYKAKISNYGITNTKAGDPQIAVLFDFENQEKVPCEMTWFGTLKEGKGRDITLKALLTMGMRGNDIEALAGGLDSNTLNPENPVNITIDEEPDQAGKYHMRVKWINSVGGAAFRDKLTKDEAKVKLGALNLKGAMALIRAETGIKDEPKKAAPSRPAPGDFTMDDIPF